MTKPIKTCWVHIGMHKTGTTSIQQTLSKLDNVPGWSYLLLGRYKNLGVPMHGMFATHPTHYHWFGKAGQTKADVARMGQRWRDELRSFAERKRPDNLLMSAEATSLIDDAGIARLKEFLEPLADDIRIVGVVRPPVAFASSIFQQHLKHGLGHFTMEKIAPKYRSRFEKFDAVFGRDKVMLWKFDPAEFAAGGLVADFCGRIGMPAPDSKDIVRSNESLSRNACSMLYAYRKLGGGYGRGPDVVRENKSLINALFVIKGSKFKLDSSLVLQGLQAHAEDIRWMEERLGRSLAEEAERGSDDIASEQDLLKLAPGSIATFAKAFFETSLVHVDHNADPGHTPTPEEMAAFMERCRTEFRVKMLGGSKTAPDHSNQRREKDMKIADVIESVKQSDPAAFGAIPSKNALLLVRKVLQAVAEKVAAAKDDEPVKIPALGTFRTKTVSQEKDGASVSRRRTVYAPVTAKEAGAVAAKVPGKKKAAKKAAKAAAPV